LVKRYLQSQWSPEQISAEVSISHETIYRHIYADKSFGGTLYSHLRCQKSGENDMLAAERDVDKSLVGEPFPSALPILKSVSR